MRTETNWNFEGRDRQFVAIGGAVFASSPFLVWAKIAILGEMNLFTLLSAGHNSRALAWIAVVVGSSVALTAVRAKRSSTVRLVGLVVGMVLALYSIGIFVEFTNDASESYGLARIGWGPIAAIAGSVAMFVGAFLRPSDNI